MSYGITLTSSPAKSIYVYRNGDTNFQCKKVVVNPRQVKNWDAFIELITARVKAKNGGAVRRVFTPTGRTAVSDLTSIENNHFYVAAGTEGFKRHQYNKIATLTPPKTRLSLPPIIKPVQHSRLKVSARCKRAAGAVGTKIIYVFRNGDDKSSAVRILFKKFMLKDYNVVLEEVTRKVNFLTGAVWKLHTLDGRQIQGPEEFEDQEFYVAAGKENFKKVPYPKDATNVSPRVAKPTPPRYRIARLSKESKASKESKTSKSSKPAQEQKPSKPSKPSKPTPPKIKKEKSPEQKEAEEVFHHKPTMVKRSRERDQQKEAALDYSDDPEGVFKAKEERNETKGAAEVQETMETAIDLPIDQVAAEEVEEEEDLDAGKDEDAQPADQSESPRPQPPEEQVNMVEKMLDDDEVPEDIPDDAPPAVDEDENVKDGGDGGGGNGDDDGNEVGGAHKEDPAEVKKEEEQNEQPPGFYSKRSPVTSKNSPIIGEADDDIPISHPTSEERVPSPNENNNNVTDDQNISPKGKEVVESGGTPVPPITYIKTKRRRSTPIVSNRKSPLSRENSSENREGLTRLSPHPPATKRSVPPSPAASNRRSVTPKNLSNSVESRPQSESGNVEDSAPSPKAQTSPTIENEQSQSHVDSNTPRPVSGTGQDVKASLSPYPPPSEHATPSPAVENRQRQSPVENNTPRPISGTEQDVKTTSTPQPSPSQHASPSPAAGNGQSQSPVENNTADPVIQDAPHEQEGDQNVENVSTPPPAPSEHAPPPAENDQIQSPNENNNNNVNSSTPRLASGNDQNDKPILSPHPSPSEKNVSPFPAANSGLVQTPVENNSARPVSLDGQLENGGDQNAVVATTPAPAPSEHPHTSPVIENNQTQSPNENNNNNTTDHTPRPVSVDEQNAQAVLTPHPPPSERNVPSSPAASNGQAQSHVENNTPRPPSASGPPEAGGDQVVDSAPSPKPSPSQNAPTPTSNNGHAQSPAEDPSPKPESVQPHPENDEPSQEHPTVSPQPTPTVPNNPASPIGDTEPSQSPVDRDVLSESGDAQAADTTNSKENESALSQKDVNNAADTEPVEGQVAA